MTLLVLKTKLGYIVCKQRYIATEEPKKEKLVEPKLEPAISVANMYFHPVGRRYNEKKFKSFLVTAEKNKTELLYAPQVKDISDLVVNI